MRTRTQLIVTSALVLILPACATAPKRAAVAPPEDLVFPVVQPGELAPSEFKRLEAGWGALVAGDLTQADKQLRRLLAGRPRLVPAETALGYIAFQGGRYVVARERFDGALAARGDYFPALMGAGATAQREGRTDDAFDFYKRAVAAEARDPRAQRRLAEVRVQVTEARVAAGRLALASGDSEAGIALYRQALEASPEVNGVRLELTEALVGQGDLPGAIQALRDGPSPDRPSLLRLAVLLGEAGAPERALEVYERLLSRDSHDVEAQAGANAMREAVRLAELPEEYRRALVSPRITRADLAALLAIHIKRLGTLPPREPQVAVDISGSWARDQIATVLALGIMDVYPNHSFQPAAGVRRGDLALAVARVLDLLRVPRTQRLVPTDMAATHLQFDAAGRVLGAGLMETTAIGAFEAWRPVTGPEAVRIVDGVARLASP